MQTLSATYIFNAYKCNFGRAGCYVRVPGVTGGRIGCHASRLDVWTADP